MTDVTAPHAASADPGELMQRLESHRVELTAHCYRMLGSAFEAEDAVQETLVKAWKAHDSFEGRASLRSWLYRIATNVCLDMLKAGQRRARPMDLTSPGTAASPLPEMLPEAAWVEPMPDARVLPSGGDPADVAVARESVRLAFVAALQHLPPRQRAVLILREVLAWRASEVAELLGTTVASVNSALQRARATLDAGGLEPGGAAAEPDTEGDRALLARYVDAFERYDMDQLTALLHDDVVLSMPPYPLWMRGPEQVRAWMLGTGSGCRGSRLVPVAANGMQAYGQYRPAELGEGWIPWAIQVIEVENGRVSGLNSFLDTARLFPLFGLPPALDANGDPADAPLPGGESHLGR